MIVDHDHLAAPVQYLTTKALKIVVILAKWCVVRASLEAAIRLCNPWNGWRINGTSGVSMGLWSVLANNIK